MKLNNKETFLKQDWEKFNFSYYPRVKDVQCHRKISEHHLSDDCFVTFGTDVLCVLYKDNGTWKIFRIFDYYNLSLTEFMHKIMEEDNWELLDKGEN